MVKKHFFNYVIKQDFVEKFVEIDNFNTFLKQGFSYTVQFRKKYQKQFSLQC